MLNLLTRKRDSAPPLAVRLPRPPTYSADAALLIEAANRCSDNAHQFLRDGRATDAACAVLDEGMLRRCAVAAALDHAARRPAPPSRAKALRFARAVLAKSGN